MNWCSNTLVVIGEPNILKNFRDKARGEGPEDRQLVFNNLHQIPSEEELNAYQEESREPTLMSIICDIGVNSLPNDYKWRLDNWGTKWDGGPHEEVKKDSEGSFIIEFETAWHPPLPLIAKCSGDFPELLFKIEYEEPGNGFCGVSTYMGGELIAETEKMLWE